MTAIDRGHNYLLERQRDCRTNVHYCIHSLYTLHYTSWTDIHSMPEQCTLCTHRQTDRQWRMDGYTTNECYNHRYQQAASRPTHRHTSHSTNLTRA